MRLLWFEVQGYKNISAPLRLEELGRVDVVHGDNNVGKSNLLESIGLYFALIQALRENARGEISQEEAFARRAASGTGSNTARSFSYFAGRGFPPNEIFNLEQPTPIELCASLHLGPGEVAPEDPAWLSQPFQLGVRIERHDERDELSFALTRLLSADGTDLVKVSGVEADKAIEHTLERVGPRRRGRFLYPRFALLRADRTIAAFPLRREVESAPLSTREPLPPELGLGLYDAESSADPLERNRFDRFVLAMERFRDILGEGALRVRYDRQADRAELFLDGRSTRIPLRLMGSGVQQIASLIGRLVLVGADIVALEEPELNLRFIHQLRLRELLVALTEEGGEPSQLLLTSHSSAFETEQAFHLLSRSPQGPRIQRRPKEEAPTFTDFPEGRPPEGAHAPLAYVTSEGLVLVPDQVRRALSLEHGGGVFFIREKDTGHYRMLSNEQYFDLFEPRDRS